MTDHLRAALELAEQQLVALELGDADAFLNGAEAYEAACAALATHLEENSLDRDELPLLEQLVATNRLVSAGLASAMNDVSGRLSSMVRGRGATSAYLATMPGGLAGLREA
ncbi:MAG: hypothetical protein HS107_12975 [Thermoflexaceae bacterium]|nr:hypothetical protein [Thermoflexaceae bacterium]